MHSTPFNRVIAHKKVEMHNFLKPYKDVFITTGEGKSWPKWRNTWNMAQSYYQGLLRPGRQKNMYCISVRMNVQEDQIERFIRESPWEYEALQDHLASHIPDNLQDSNAVLIIDDVGLIKQGKHSVGVKRQYSGALGKVGNCQVAVNVTYAAPGMKRNANQKTWPLGMRLYLPEEWIEDELRREEVGIPEDITFQTKPQIARNMLERILTHNIEHKAIIADAGFGDSSDFREELRRMKEPYVLGITPSSIRVIDANVALIEPGTLASRGRPRKTPTFHKDTIVQSASDIAAVTTEWTTVQWSEGKRGKLSAEFHRVFVRVTKDPVNQRHATDEVGWLLLEKAKKGIKTYFCWGLDNATLKELVTIAHLRWTIEQFHKEAKQLLGLDRFEGRSWKGWHHHVSMVLLAYAFISKLRALQLKDPLPSMKKIIKSIVLEVATQQLIIEHKLKRQPAQNIATTMLRGYSDW